VSDYRRDPLRSSRPTVLRTRFGRAGGNPPSESRLHRDGADPEADATHLAKIAAMLG